MSGNNSVYWELGIGQAFSSAPTYVSANATYSGFEVGTGGTMDGNPAIVFDGGYVVSGASQKGAIETSVNNKYPITLNAAGAVRDLGSITLYGTGIGATSAMRAIFKWKEVR